MLGVAVSVDGADTVRVGVGVSVRVWVGAWVEVPGTAVEVLVWATG